LGQTTRNHSTLRILPVEQARTTCRARRSGKVEIDGYNSSVFHNGDLSYVVSNVRREVACTDTSEPAPSTGGAPTCYAWTHEVQVVDRTGNAAVKRGKVALPEIDGSYWYGGWGWYGCYAWDWLLRVGRGAGGRRCIGVPPLAAGHHRRHAVGRAERPVRWSTCRTPTSQRSHRPR